MPTYIKKKCNAYHKQRKFQFISSAEIKTRISISLTEQTISYGALECVFITGLLFSSISFDFYTIFPWPDSISQPAFTLLSTDVRQIIKKQMVLEIILPNKRLFDFLR